MKWILIQQLHRSYIEKYGNFEGIMMGVWHRLNALGAISAQLVRKGDMGSNNSYVICVNKTLVLLAICALLVFSGCKDGATQAHNRAQALSVAGLSITPSDVELSFEYPARLKSVQSVNVYARVQGILLSQNFSEGDIVKAGQLLFRIDPARYQMKVNQAAAQFSSMQASFIKAERDWKRVSRLYKQGVYTIDQYDNSHFSYLSAKAALENAKAALEDAKIDLSYTDVSASISGRVGMRRYDVGNLVGNSGQDVLTTITQLSPIYAEFSIPSYDYYFMRDLKEGEVQASFILGDGKIYEQKGQLDFIDSVLDTQTATIKARAVVSNDAHKLVPNEFVRVRLAGFIAKNAISIPQSALLQDTQGSYVFILRDDVAKIAHVTLGQNLKNNYVLILGGLQAGDIIATNQLAKLRDGMPISLQNAESSQHSESPTPQSAQDSVTPDKQ